jgi:hypothetical protein
VLIDLLLNPNTCNSRWLPCAINNTCPHHSDTNRHSYAVRTFRPKLAQASTLLTSHRLFRSVLNQTTNTSFSILSYSSFTAATLFSISQWGGGGGVILCPRPDLPWGPPSLLYNGYRVSLPGVKRPRRGVNRPPHLAPRLKKE